jgi:20S proteasome alpha/beta subunit
MVAGNDVTEAFDVLLAAKREIENLTSCTLLEVTNVVKRAYQSKRTARLEDTYLSAYRLDMNSFIQNGRNLLGDSAFEQTKFQMDQFDFGFTCLVCGFRDVNANFPLFFEVTNPGVVFSRTVPGYYAAIGSGAPNALTYLDWRKQTRETPLSRAVYNGIAAKSMSESALGVGKETVGLVIERATDFPTTTLTTKQIADIRNIWQSEEADVRPARLQSRVSEILTSKPSP